MKYQITFADPNNIADQRVIDVSLTDDERETASAQDLPELHAQCYALRHAYKQAPKGCSTFAVKSGRCIRTDCDDRAAPVLI